MGKATTKVQGYHCESWSHESLHHLCAATTRDLRSQLRALGMRLGYWRAWTSLGLCEGYAGTDHLPGAQAYVYKRGRVVGTAFRHGGKEVPMGRRERARWNEFLQTLKRKYPQPPETTCTSES